jgi:nucleoside-diphosphate-sugar epimerase
VTLNSTNDIAGSRVLVTGAAGFLGSQLSERLVADGHTVLGIDCFTDFYARRLKESNLEQLHDSGRFELFDLDLATDPIDDVLADVEVVYHLAAQAGVRGSFGEGFDHYVHNNVQATQRLLEAAVRNPVDALVYASSSAVYGNAETYPTPETAERRPVSPYGMTKCSTEDLAGVYHRNHGLPVVGLRYFTAYGPRQRPDMAFSRFLDAALDGRPLTILGDGQQIRDFTFVDDVVEGTIAAAAHGSAGGVYNIGGGTPTSLMGVISMLEELLERQIEVEHVPSARGDARQTCSDPSRARDELGFSPAVELADGLALQLEWTLEEGHRLDAPVGLRAVA